MSITHIVQPSKKYLYSIPPSHLKVTNNFLLLFLVWTRDIHHFSFSSHSNTHSCSHQIVRSSKKNKTWCNPRVILHKSAMFVHVALILQSLIIATCVLYIQSDTKPDDSTRKTFVRRYFNHLYIYFVIHVRNCITQTFEQLLSNRPTIECNAIYNVSSYF